MNVLQFVANLFVNVGAWLGEVLSGWGLSPLWTAIVVKFLAGLVVAGGPLAAVLFLIWYARKVIGRIQDRMGPTNDGTAAGPFALLQAVADAIKMLTKEFVFPTGRDKVVFLIAPVLVVAVAVAIWAVIPFGPPDAGMQFVDLNIGVFYVVALASLTFFSMLMAGWSSHNKYANLGAFRAVSMIVSYEIPQMLALLVPVMLAGTMGMQGLINAQEVPFIVMAPIPALIYFLAMTAEVGRLPFEQAEADAEIVAGYFIEYSGMLFGAFYLAEFINNLSASFVFSILFLGGWRGPWVEQAPILGLVWLSLKAFIVFSILTFFWGAMPRLRIDHILGFSWKFLTPLALVMLMVTALVDKIVQMASHEAVLPWTRAGWLFLANAVVARLTAWVLHQVEKRRRAQREARRFAVVR